MMMANTAMIPPMVRLPVSPINTCANQLQVARAKVQEEKPVFAVVEPAVVPLKPSGISKKVYVLVFIFLSVCIVMFWKLFGEEFLDKIKEIRA